MQILLLGHCGDRRQVRPIARTLMPPSCGANSIARSLMRICRGGANPIGGVINKNFGLHSLRAWEGGNACSGAASLRFVSHISNTILPKHWIAARIAYGGKSDYCIFPVSREQKIKHSHFPLPHTHTPDKCGGLIHMNQDVADLLGRTTFLF